VSPREREASRDGGLCCLASPKVQTSSGLLTNPQPAEKCGSGVVWDGSFDGVAHGFGRYAFAHPQDRHAQPSWSTSQPIAASSSTRDGSRTRTSCSPAKKVVMRMLVSGVRQTTRCGPNLFSLTQRLSAKLW